jgi:IclR family transcriptional regulator, KDG regulon repressor
LYIQILAPGGVILSNVQSVERALKLLNVISEYPDGIQIARLTEQVDLSKSTIHRLLSTLHNMNYVVKVPETDKYKLGYQVVYLSRNVLNSDIVKRIAQPYLEELSKDVNETIHLCIEDIGEVLYIDKIESNQTIRMFSRVGNRAPMYCTGVGKILLSGLQPEEFDRVIRNTNFIAKTANTIITKKELIDEVENVGLQGYALDNIENEEGIRCIAAPIIDYQGSIIASFSISGPSNRITMERVHDELISKIKKTSLAISQQLGFSNA